MTSNELRIGNWVKVTKRGGYNSIGDEITVNSITSRGINQWQDMNASGENTFDGIEGIPLTDQWLLGFGFFKVKPRSGVFEAFLKRSIRIERSNSGHYYYKGRTVCVHQLQNIYYAIYGEELILK